MTHDGFVFGVCADGKVFANDEQSAYAGKAGASHFVREMRDCAWPCMLVWIKPGKDPAREYTKCIITDYDTRDPGFWGAIRATGMPFSKETFDDMISYVIGAHVHERTVQSIYDQTCAELGVTGKQSLSYLDVVAIALVAIGLGAIFLVGTVIAMMRGAS